LIDSCSDPEGITKRHREAHDAQHFRAGLRPIRDATGTAWMNWSSARSWTKHGH
jgi:hypothetical protein